MKKKSKVKGLLIFVLVVVMIGIIFFPVLMNLVLCPLLTGEKMCESLGILAWIPCFRNFVITQITVGFQIMLLAGSVALFLSGNKPSFAHGDEHGSARILTGEEFDDLVPSYTFLNDMEVKKQ